MSVLRDAPYFEHQILRHALNRAAPLNHPLLRLGVFRVPDDDLVARYSLALVFNELFSDISAQAVAFREKLFDPLSLLFA